MPAIVIDLNAETELTSMYGQHCLMARTYPRRETYAQIAHQRGWSIEAFERWANIRTWAK